MHQYGFPFLGAFVSSKWQRMSRSLIQCPPTLAGRSELLQRRKLLLVLASSKFFILLDAHNSSIACLQGQVAYPESLQHDTATL